MTIWQDALEGQLEAQRVVNYAVQRGVEESLRAGLKTDQYLVRWAMPYAWGNEVIASVAQAAQTIPDDTTLDRWNLEDAHAIWWYFETPLPVRTLRDSKVGIRAMSCGWLKRGSVHSRGTGHSFVGGCWVDYHDPERAKLAPTLIWEWHEGESVREMHDRVNHEHTDLYGPGGKFSNIDHAPVDEQVYACEWLSKFVLAGMAWLNQRILIQTEGHVHRQRRKEFERRTGHKIPYVKVVTLRRADRPEPSSDSTVSSDREYSCRWVVDGHWRNAAVGPGRTQRRLTYVHPYVKGPEDKPLRVPSSKVFLVNR